MHGRPPRTPRRIINVLDQMAQMVETGESTLNNQPNTNYLDTKDHGSQVVDRVGVTAVNYVGRVLRQSPV